MKKQRDKVEGIKVEKSIIIRKPPTVLYHFWRNFENLPQIMNHLKSVTVLNASKSRWVAKAPAGTSVEWDAEIIKDKVNELISWRSVEGDVDHTGSVHFDPVPEGTQVRVMVQYHPPGGKIGAAVAKLFGEEPSQQIEDDLNRFKAFMEGTETPPAEQQILEPRVA
ncbi:MAG: SRPBCC family protein [Nitrospirae bacterium]|nr:SRPBCC family protein [Candidatus Manganitrophaceae bacterium]